MARAERWARALLAAALLGTPSRAALADTAAPPSRLATGPSAPSRVEIALIGELERDPALFERIRSLFPRELAVVLSRTNRLDSGAVLQPERADTLYVWIRVNSRTRARVYLVAREGSAGSTRYLFRDVVLESGLDEVASETLAQVAHSASEALWLREQETPKHQVVEALASEPAATPPPVAVLPPPEPASNRPTTALDSGVARPARPRSSPFALGFGASFVTHASGAEGWLAEPGVFVTAEYRETLALRFAAQYVVPTEFDLLPARVRLSGASGELRASWASSKRAAARVRLEAGLAVLIARWSASIANDDPPAHVNSARDFVRPSALAGGAIELPFGPGWLAARAELRAPFRRTQYEIKGQSATATSSYLNPGGGLEFGVLLD